LGLLGMQERVEALGGAYVIESESGRGTCVCITIPVQSNSDADRGGVS